MAETGRPDDSDEIEVTPEMIDVGAMKLFDYDPALSNERGIVETIFVQVTKIKKAARR